MQKLLLSSVGSGSGSGSGTRREVVVEELPIWRGAINDGNDRKSK